MSKAKHGSFLSASLKCSVALLPLSIAVAQMPAHAQATKTAQQLQDEADAAKKAAAANSADAEDAAAIAEQLGGLTGTSKSTTNSRDIVVTGTNIRGVAPTGSDVTTLSSDDIKATGQASTQQILAQIPQMGSFNGIPQIGAGAQGQGTVQVVRTNLRGTPDSGTGD